MMLRDDEYRRASGGTLLLSGPGRTANFTGSGC